MCKCTEFVSLMLLVFGFGGVGVVREGWWWGWGGLEDVEMCTAVKCGG